jgi:hypothetical protein
MGLALLPRCQVKNGFKLQSKNADPRIQPFIDYFRKQWIVDMSPDLWCVADSKIRTNNSCEGKSEVNFAHYRTISISFPSLY